MNEFNGSIETTFFGFPHTNIQMIITKAQIGSQHIIGLNKDILLYNVTQCTNPERNLAIILHSIILALLCLASFLFQLSLFPTFWHLPKLRGPAFIILLNMLLCSSLNLFFSFFIFYLESAIGFRLPIYDLDIYISQLPQRGESVFYFLFTANRCAALIFPFKYSSIFTKQKIFWLICLSWFYCLLDRAEFILANKGINRIHCPDGVNDAVEYYSVIMDPSMLVLKSLSKNAYYIVWYTPMLMDGITLGKLFFDKYRLQSKIPWIVKRLTEGVIRIEEGRNERIKLFLICFITTIYHFIWAFAFSKNAWTSDLGSFYNYSYILENVMPYLLMLCISRDVRNYWKRTLQQKRGRIQPIDNANMYPTTEL